MVPSPSICCSVGLWRSPRTLCKVPEVEGAQAPGQEKGKNGDQGVLGKDNHTAPAHWLGKGMLAEGAAPPAGECLQASCLCVLLQLRQDRQTANEYLWLSLPYLQNSQASLRYEAVEFIGEPNPWDLLWALPWQQSAALQPPDKPCPCQ